MNLDNYKIKPTQSTSIAEGVEHRLQENLKRIKNTQLSVLDKCRNLPGNLKSSPVVVNQRLSQDKQRYKLKKWLDYKEKKKQELAVKKKKPFVTGVVHSPLYFVPPAPFKTVPRQSHRVYKSQNIESTKSFALLKQHKKALLKPGLSFAKDPIYEKKILPVTKKSPMRSEQIMMSVEHFCPIVNCSRGKDDSKREINKETEHDEDTCEILTVQVFKQNLDSEWKRFKVWDDIYKEIKYPDAVQELIIGAVEQTRLLMLAKLQLVERCKYSSLSAQPVTPADLQGFWDTVLMQIFSIHTRFNKLEALKAQEWVEEHSSIPSVLNKTISGDISKSASNENEEHEDTSIVHAPWNPADDSTLFKEKTKSPSKQTTDMATLKSKNLMSGGYMNYLLRLLRRIRGTGNNQIFAVEYKKEKKFFLKEPKYYFN